MSINQIKQSRYFNSTASRAKQRIAEFTIAMLLGLSGIFFVTTAEAAIIFQKLVDQGQERPDKADPSSADTFLEVACAVIDGDDVVFRSLNDGFRTGFDSIWTIKADGSGLRKLIGKNRLAPGGVGRFSAFGPNNGGDFTTSPLLRNGRVVFFGNDSNPDLGLRGVGGLYSIRLSDGTLKRIANYNTTNPSTGGFKFGQFSNGGSRQVCHNSYAFNGSKVFFAAATFGNNDPAGVYQAAFDGRGLSKVRDNNDPDTSFPFFQPKNFYGPTLGVNPLNGVALYGYAGSNVFSPQALYPGYPGNSHLLVRADNLPGDPSPEDGGSAFSDFLFDGRTAVFFAEAFTVSGRDYYGIFSRPGTAGPIRKIVSNLNKLPGIAQCPVNVIGNFVADAGRVFFFANTTNCDGLTANGRMGIFMAKDNKIQRIVSTGTPLGDGSSVVEVMNELGPGSVQGNRLVFSARTTKALRSLYVANLP